MARFKFYALWLSLVCILVFILQTLFSGFTELMLLDQNSFPQLWRFLTAIFLHGSIIHIMYNLFALALFGSILEKFIGGKKFLAVFFLSGIFANIIAFNFYPASLGASGAVYGILGALTIMKPGMMVWAFGFPMPMFIAAILWIAGGVLGLFIPGNTGHIAHLSGIAVGFILGILYRIALKKRKMQRQAIVEVSEPSEPDMRKWESSYIIQR